MAPPAQRSGEETRASSVVLGCAVQPHRFWSVSSRSDFNEAVLAPRPPQESPVKGVDSDGLPTVSARGRGVGVQREPSPHPLSGAPCLVALPWPLFRRVDALALNQPPLPRAISLATSCLP